MPRMRHRGNHAAVIDARPDQVANLEVNGWELEDLQAAVDRNVIAALANWNNQINVPLDIGGLGGLQAAMQQQPQPAQPAANAAEAEVPGREAAIQAELLQHDAAKGALARGFEHKAYDQQEVIRRQYQAHLDAQDVLNRELQNLQILRRQRAQERVQALQNAQDLAAEIAEEAEMAGIRVVNNFKVGADPEFAIVAEDGKLVYVNGLNQQGAVGYDHGGRIVELRPRASKSTYNLVKTLRDIIVKHDDLEPFRKYRWRAGGLVANPATHRQEPLGGHVHLGIPPVAGQAYKDLAAALDALTKVYENLDILPTNESKARRDLKMLGNRHDYYGAYSNLVEAGKGNIVRHMEYRTPCSWLSKPQTAFFVLTGYKLAAKEPKATAEFFATVRAQQHELLNLRDFYDKFRAEDSDVARFREKLRIKSTVGDPDQDFQTAWRDMNF